MLLGGHGVSSTEPEAPEPVQLLASLALGALLLSLSFGATVHEVAAIGGAVTALVLLARGVRPDLGPLAGPAVLVAVGWMVMALAPEGSSSTSARRVWTLAPVVLVPVLLAASGPLPWARILVFAALPAALVGGVQDHHLTWAYCGAILAAAAWGTGLWWAALIFAGSVLSTGALGGGVALVVALAVCEADRRAGARASLLALGAGVACTLAALWVLPWERALVDRVILWTGGARLLADGGVAPGAWRSAVDGHHMALEPSFFFPHHAHDAFIQAAAEAGPGAWVALAWAGWIVWTQGESWLRGALAALVVGAMTQDVVGDVEVLRTALVVGTLALAGGLTPASRNSDGSTMSIAPEEAHVDVAAGGAGPG